MRILIAGRGFDTLRQHAVGLFELDQAKALMAAGHDVRFAALDVRSARRLRPWGVHCYELEGMYVYYYALPVGGVPRSVHRRVMKLAGRRLFRVIESSDWKPDVIHAHFSAGMGFYREAKRAGIPFVFTEHLSGANVETLPAAELAREKELYPQVDKLLCVSETLAGSIAKHTGARAQVIHNIADTSVFSAASRKTARGKNFVFAAAGNLFRRKGYDLLLDALALLRERGHTPQLLILGGGEEREALQKQAEQLGISEQIRFLGHQSREKMAEAYQTADAFVLPSRLETFGVVYIEAMAAGLPVIATACGGPEDFVNEENGILIPTENVDALTDAMERMINNYANYDAAAIARFARENFSPETIASGLTEIYKTLL